jgi:thiol-disulfide isomerase/thioredoxin
MDDNELQAGDNEVPADDKMPAEAQETPATTSHNGGGGMKYARWALLLVSIIGLVASMGYISFGGMATPLPAFASLVATDLHDEEMSFQEFAGDILVVDFWAIWCGPCITEIPHYNSLYADYKDQGFSMVGLTVESGTAVEVLEWMASDPAFRMQYPLVMSNDELMEAFGPVFGFPTTLLIDRDGTIVKRWIGTAPKKSDQIRELVDKLLAGEPVTDDHNTHED